MSIQFPRNICRHLQHTSPASLTVHEVKQINTKSNHDTIFSLSSYPASSHSGRVPPDFTIATDLITALLLHLQNQHPSDKASRVEGGNIEAAPDGGNTWMVNCQLATGFYQHPHHSQHQEAFHNNSSSSNPTGSETVFCIPLPEDLQFIKVNY